MAFNPVELQTINMNREESVKGHAPSLLPSNKKWKLVWNDEFDGNVLNEDNWDYRLYFWGHESPTFTKEGIEVSDGTLKINLVRKGDDFYSAHLQTGSLTFDKPVEPDVKSFYPFGEIKPPKFLHKYGYYEIRCRLPKHSGWHAAFWLQAPGIGSHPIPERAGVECDIMENYRQHSDGKMICGCGWGGYGKNRHWYGHYEFDYKETEDGWHYYGVDWSKDGYTFYTDGKLIGSQLAPECVVSDVEQFLLVSTECHGYHRHFTKKGGEGETTTQKKEWGNPVEELFSACPDCFEIDFVRVYDAVEED